MLFQSATFGILLLATLVAFYRLPQKHRLTVLAFSSVVFYAVAGLLDFILLMAILVITSHLSLRVREGGSVLPIVITVGMLLGALGFFKYGEFVYENANSALTAVGVSSLPR